MNRTTGMTERLGRSSVAIGVAIGLLAGSLVTALVTAGEDEVTTTAATGTPSAEAESAADAPEAGPSAESEAVLTETATGSSSTTAPAVSGAAAPRRPATGTAAAPTAARTATAGPDACGGTATSGIRGVTDTTIKLGVGITDIEALYPVLGPNANLGDQIKHFDAHLAALRKKGVLPICGRDIVPVYRKFTVLDASQSRAACQAWMNDDNVFAVVTHFAFQAPDCVTNEHKSFLLDHGLSLTEANFATAGGRLFALHPVLEKNYEIWANWASKEILKGGKKVGVYYNNNNPDQDARVKRHILDVLRRNGHEPVVATTNTAPAASAQGADPNDAVAVQRLRGGGANVVMLVNTAFRDEAKRQGYRPLYIFAGTNVKDSTAGSYDPEYMDGTLGVHWDQENDFSNGVPPSPRAQECIKEATDAGIKRPREEWAEWSGSNLTCDLLAVLTRGLQAAGKNLTTDRLVLGVRTIQNLEGALTAPLSFSAQKQWGVNQARTARYDKGCKCWKNVGPFAPLPL